MKMVLVVFIARKHGPKQQWSWRRWICGRGQLAERERQSISATQEREK